MSGHSLVTPIPWTGLVGDGECEPYPLSSGEVDWGEVMELNLGHPTEVTVEFVNLWCEVGGEGNRRRTKAR